MKKRKGFDKGIIFLVVIFLIIGGTAAFFLSRMKVDPMADLLAQDESAAMVFMIVDEDELLATEIFFFHPVTHKGALLDVPSNTGDIVESVGRIDKISILFDNEKPDAYIGKLEEITSSEIPFYFIMDLEQVESMVDLVEGLSIFIANPVEISEELIFLPSGSLVLDGAKARTFITYSEEGEIEIEKTDRREKFIQALLRAWGENYEALVHEDVFPMIFRNVDTNLSEQAFMTFLGALRELDGERMVFQRVLGVEREVDDQSLLFRHKDGILLKETVRQTLKSLANIEVVSDEELRIGLEVLNGTNNTGLAGRTGQLFKSFGYDVANIGNYEEQDLEKTVVIDRSGDITRAQRVAAVINCTRIERQTEEISEGGIVDSTIDVTVLLGKDFDGRYCKE